MPRTILIIPATAGNYDLGPLSHEYGNNQLSFAFYTDAQCTSKATGVTGALTVSAKSFLDCSFVAIADGVLNVATTAQLRFSGIAEYVRINCASITNAAYIKVIIDNYIGDL
jgi:hypothetical protein